MHEQSHSIVRLAVHLPFEQIFFFKPGYEEAALSKSLANNTTLTAWFNLNRIDLSAHRHFYHNILNFYVFDDKNKKWTMRKKKSNKGIIGRMYMVSPNEGERYYLRLLLLHVKGACSYEDIKTVNDKIYSSFKEAAIAR
jgi:ATP-dependent DNA helicase PIF1